MKEKSFQKFLLDQVSAFDETILAQIQLPEEMNKPQPIQSFVNQVPKFERVKPERRGRRENQVLSKGQIIRPDKRQKPKYF